MTNLAKAIRSKRFHVRTDANVSLVIQLPSGTTATMKLTNCSINGLGATTAVLPSEDEGFTQGHVLPASKLILDDQEIFLGRLIFRTASVEDGEIQVGLQTIDSKVPVDGPLSRALEISDDNFTSAYDYELDPEKFNLATFKEAEQPNVDLFSRCKQFAILYEKWRQSPKYQYKNIRLPSKGTRVELAATRRGGRNDYIIMGSNDYLGLAHHPKVLEAAKSAIDAYGFGSTGSPVSTGGTKLHEELCDFLARMFKKEKAILFNSGYAANVGIISGLTGATDLVVADILSHASLQDGMQMANSTARYFKHNQVDHLEKILATERKQFSGTLVVTEGVFSMDGDVAPMKEIITVAKRHNARVFLDEAHSLGVIGPNGMGAAAKFGVMNETDIIMGTFSKICGGIGGFAVGSADVIEWLYHFSRAHVFSVSIPPSTAAASLQALKLFVEEPRLVSDLQKNISHFVKGLIDLGFNLKKDHESAVIPAVIGDERILGEMNQVLLNEGVFVVPVVYPAVSRKGSRFRFTVTSGHTTSDLDFVLSVMEKAMTKANFSVQPFVSGKQVA